MQRKKGISLIVLVITIIVMIILAASVVITLSNTGIIDKANQAVNLTNESQVQDFASLIWADAYMDELRGTDLETAVKNKLKDQGIEEDKWNITVTDTGVTVTNKNAFTTLGSLIIDPKVDYGKLVDYSANGVNEWKVYYEDEMKGYVFLIAKESVEVTNNGLQLANVTADINTTYNIFKLGQTGYTLLDSYVNSRCIAWMITNYSSYADTTESYKDYVVGAIGGPTIELLAAGYNAKYPMATTKLIPIVDTSYTEGDYEANGYYNTNGAYGYFINAKGRTSVGELIPDELYTYSNNCWVASPSSYDDDHLDNCIIYVGYDYIDQSYSGDTFEIRPVVCLRSDIPATATADGYSLVK